MKHKTCSKCGKEKLIEEFYFRSSSKDGRRGQCIECIKSKRICGIYCIENLIDGNKYIGYANDIKRRFSCHLCGLKRNNHANRYLQNAWNKYGEENFKFYIIEECEEEELSEKEVFYIKAFNCKSPFGYNLTDGGEGLNPSEETRVRMSEAGKGRIFTEEHKKHLSENHADFSGDNAPMKGKHHTEEAKNKASLSKIGEKNPMFGKHFSEESSKKLSLSLSGINSPRIKSKEEVLEIKNMIDNGFMQKDIMKILHVGQRIIIKVKNGWYKNIYGI